MSEQMTHSTEFNHTSPDVSSEIMDSVEDQLEAAEEIRTNTNKGLLAEIKLFNELTALDFLEEEMGGKNDTLQNQLEQVIQDGSVNDPQNQEYFAREMISLLQEANQKLSAKGASDTLGSLLGGDREGLADGAITMGIAKILSHAATNERSSFMEAQADIQRIMQTNMPSFSITKGEKVYKEGEWFNLENNESGGLRGDIRLGFNPLLGEIGGFLKLEKDLGYLLKVDSAKTNVVVGGKIDLDGKKEFIAGVETKFTF